MRRLLAPFSHWLDRRIDARIVGKPLPAGHQALADFAAESIRDASAISGSHSLDPIAHGTSVATIDLAPPHAVGGIFGDHPCGAQFVEVIGTTDGTVLVTVVTRLHDNREARTEPLRLSATAARLVSHAVYQAAAASSDPSISRIQPNEPSSVCPREGLRSQIHGDAP